MGKYLEFVPVFDDVVVVNKKTGHPLGKIEFYGPWKQYVFAPISDTVFNDTCLLDIVGEMQKMNHTKKDTRREVKERKDEQTTNRP